MFLRSTWKPLIAAAIAAQGVVERFGLDAREVAVIAASHGGEPFHVAAVESILAKIGVSAGALQCGIHGPSYEPAARALAARGEKPSALHNNCSGKHAGILALCVHLGLDLESYMERDHPAQRLIWEFCARMCDDDAGVWPTGVDGCGIPVAATPLRRAAMAFARFAAPGDLAGADAAGIVTVRAAMQAEPAYVAGTGRFDSALMRVTGGRIACKGGAEGVHGSALLREGLGVVLKVVDGSARAAAPAAICLLERLGALTPEESAALESYARPAVTNVSGRAVGGLEARYPDTTAQRSSS